MAGIEIEFTSLKMQEYRSPEEEEVGKHCSIIYCHSLTTCKDQIATTG